MSFVQLSSFVRPFRGSQLPRITQTVLALARYIQGSRAAQEAKRGKRNGIMQPLETLRRHTRERGTKSVGSTRPPHAESPCLLELQGQGQQMQLHRLQYSHLRLSGLLAPAPPESSARRFAPSGLSRSRWCEEP